MFLGLEMPDVAFGYPAVLAIALYYFDSVSFISMILLALFWPIALGVTALCLVVQSQTYGEAGEGITEQI